MRQRPILFFDDHPLRSDNKLFVTRLRSKLSGQRIPIRVLRTIATLESTLKSSPALAVILDIMSEVPRGYKDAEGKRVSAAQAGLEVLRRCRAGNYHQANVEVPIFMRSSRGEGYIRQECLTLGATGFFLTGQEDTRLVARLLSCVKEHSR